MEWDKSPEWATHKLTLKGGTQLWASEQMNEVVFAFKDTEQKVDVVASEQRPQWKTSVYLKDKGKLVHYEAEGQLSHHQAKRMLKEAGYDVRGLSFMLEYAQII